MPCIVVPSILRRDVGYVENIPKSRLDNADRVCMSFSRYHKAIDHVLQLHTGSKKQNINAYDDKIEEKERENNDTEMRKECVKFL